MSAEPVEKSEQQPARPTFPQRLQSLLGIPRAAAAWAKQQRLKAALLAVGCLTLLGGLPTAYLLLAAPRPAAEQVTLELALEALDRDDYLEACRLAGKLRERPTLPAEEFGGPAFVLGAAAAYEAESFAGKKKVAQSLVAARYLEEARNRGFPPGRDGEGLYLLGRSLYGSGQFAASRWALREALKLQADRRPEIRRLLAGTYLNDPQVKLEQALGENSLYLDEKNLTPEARQEGLLQRAEILLRQGNVAQCTATLENIPADARRAAEVSLLRGQMLLREAQSLKNKEGATAEDQQHAREKYQAAIDILRLAQSHDTLDAQATPKAMYLIGTCLLELGDDPAALSQFERTRAQYPDTPEATAASFQQAELARQMGHDADAITAYRRALGSVTDPATYSNPWLSVEQMRGRMLAAIQYYLPLRKFETALQMTRFLQPLFTQARVLDLTAEIHRTWGESLLAEAENLPEAKADALHRQGHLQFRQAGRIYWRLDRLQIVSRDYPEHLWNCASAYLEGHDYRSAVRVLQQYLQNESRQRRPQALLALGEALLAQDQIDKALVAFRECIEYHPRDAAAARARLLASKAHLEKDEIKQAEALLGDNLNGEYLTPASKEWRDSLCALGELLHDQGRYPEAIRRFREVAERYPDTPQAWTARYLMADSYRRTAKMAESRLQQEQPEDSRTHWQEQSHELLGKALAEYEQLRQTLSQRQDHAELSAQQKLMLRNCCFAIADIQLELGQPENALETYFALTYRYQNCPEALEAYVQMAAIYRRFNKPAEARATLEQAKVLLAHLNPDLPFSQSTNFDRRQWRERLDTLAAL
jgi:TolA-binding protein